MAQVGLGTGPQSPRVLVCSLGPGFDDLLRQDSSTYSRHYSRVEVCAFGSVSDLRRAIVAGYEVVHLVCTTVAGGFLETGADRISGTQLIAECCECGTKLLWVAGENAPDEYVRGFGASGRRINLVMTINRAGPGFGRFLDRLLFLLARGSQVPAAWLALVPQRPRSLHSDLPGCIFFAGWADAVLIDRL